LHFSNLFHSNKYKKHCVEQLLSCGGLTFESVKIVSDIKHKEPPKT